MRIKQGYVSPSVADFPFLKTLDLVPYHDENEPAIFIGCYTDKDQEYITDHKGFKVLHWMGQDAINAVFYGRYLDLANVNQVAFHPNILSVLAPYLTVKKIHPWTVGDWTVTPLGDNVIAYCPPSALDYHKWDIIFKLRERGIRVLLSEGSIPQDQWMQGPGDEFYDRSYLGLVLNGFAGGANTIMQLGLKGRKVVTNVLDLPHCIPFKNINDIINAIAENRKLVNQMPDKMAAEVYNSLDRSYDFLNLSTYE